MSQIKLLLDVIEGMHSLADSIQVVAEAMAGNEHVDPPQQQPLTEEKKIGVTLEQVRAVLADKSQAGFTAEVRGLLEKYGAPKLSQIDPSNYEALMADAEGLK